MPNKVDANHDECLKVWRQMGLSVIDAARKSRGLGFDAIIASGGICATIEIKDGSLSPSRRRYTDNESKHATTWKGLHALVETINEAIEVGRALLPSAAMNPSNHPTWSRLRRLDRCTSSVSGPKPRALRTRKGLE